MPSLFTFKGFVIYFWVSDGTEPIHVHVAIGSPSPVAAKFWLTEEGKAVLAANNAHFTGKDLKQIQEAIEAHFDYITQKWHETFDAEPNFYRG